jgi:hypothetical protein
MQTAFELPMLSIRLKPAWSVCRLLVAQLYLTVFASDG